MWSRLRERLGGAVEPSPTSRGTAEVHSGRPEDTGGRPESGTADQHSSTGTTPNETVVGRASGDDPGYLETGAEARAEGRAEERADNRPGPDSGRGEDGSPTSR
ncbi:hypothetical protein CRI70_24740 [Streptomyces sp. Ru87]|nr:hypothetical protein CRI70_24740 [Streptomyces sp. Ru87]